MSEVETSIDPRFWHACAGGMIQMPLLNSYVYYFPQGHAEHAHENVDFSLVSFPRILPPCILCKVIDVKFLANLKLEEVYAKIRLIPVKSDERNTADTPTVSDQLSYFAKTLTPTDATVSLSVPRDKAEMVFPKLSYHPSNQTLLAKDIHGEIWEFKHVSRGTKGRHMLTSGWKDFVREKKLVEGNSVVFTKAVNGDLRVGIIKAKVMDINSSGRGKVKREDVIEAASLAVNDQEFEITYYPRLSSPEFVVNASSVNAAERAQWNPGMRVMMPFETKNLSKEIWFVGTVSIDKDADPFLWPKSPWRRLQVDWDDKKEDLLQHEKFVNPWLVKEVPIRPRNIKNDKLITQIFGQPQQVNRPSNDNEKEVDVVISSDLCEVLLEADDNCYGILDLNDIGSYEKLEKALKDMFAINKFDDKTYVLYNDSTSVTKRMSYEEPYSEIAKAKRLIVIGDAYDLDE